MKLNREDHLNLEQAFAEEELQILAAEQQFVESSGVGKRGRSEESEKSLNPADFSMPFVKYTDRQMQQMLLMSPAAVHASLFFLSNRHVQSNFVHKHKVAVLAEKWKVARQTVYRVIDELNESGFAKLRIHNKKVAGRLSDCPVWRMKADDQIEAIYPLKIANIHMDYVFPLLGEATGATLKFFLLLAFFCDEATGNISTELRACEWAEKANYARITIERAADFLIDHGFLHAERDYVLEGRHPGVAMGFWQEKLMHIEKEKENLTEGPKRKAGIQTFEEVLLAMRRLFGIDARGWVQGHIEVAQKFLSDRINTEGAAGLRRLIERLEARDSIPAPA